MRSRYLWALCLAAACTRPNGAHVRASGPDASGADASQDGHSEGHDGDAGAPDSTAAPDSIDPDALAQDGPPGDGPDVEAPADAPPDQPTPVPDSGPDTVQDSTQDLGRDLPPDVFVAPAGCGLGVASITGINNADGVAVDVDGTVYTLTSTSSHSYVGRVLPGQAPDVEWLRIDHSPTTWGLALDSLRQRLYVLIADSPGALIVFDDIKGAPVGRRLLTDLDKANDVAIGPDGTVYYTQQDHRHVFRVAAQGGAPVMVTTSALGTTAQDQGPAALAMTPEGNLLVGMEQGGPVYAITLTNQRETARAPVGNWTGWANGLAFDRRGRLYISIYHDTAPRSVVRPEPDGSALTITAGGRFSSLAFGRGVLDCRDLYIADPHGSMRRVRVMDSL